MCGCKQCKVFPVRPIKKNNWNPEYFKFNYTKIKSHWCVSSKNINAYDFIASYALYLYRFTSYCGIVDCCIIFGLKFYC